MKYPTLLILLFIAFFTVAQEENQGGIVQPELDTGSIENQFDYIITKSSSFKEFQLIRRESILKVKKHALDSLKIVRKELNASNSYKSNQEATVEDLKNKVTSLQNKLDGVVQVKDEFTFLGGSCTKSTYNSMVWSIIVVLTIALIFFVLQFKNNYATTKKTKDELNKLEDELDQTKKKALKKEQELMRKLQDELNKNHSG
ncbi:MAG: hypothetical protein J5I47_10300 [Vicingus serpentipes]|nr:hypothetical protein [Vicingus serpentipes]